MVVYTVNQDLMIEELPEKKPLKRRILVSALLALAALGAHQIHGRLTPTAQTQIVASRPATTDDSTAVAGPNSLFGAAVVDHRFDAPVASSFGAYELDMASTVDQSALDRLTSPTIDGLDSASFKQVDISAGSSVPLDSTFSAVPEPSTAGLFLLIAAPVIGLRRPRNRGTIVNPQLQGA